MYPLIKDRKIQNASAGLSRDWGWTGGEIFRDGKIVSQKDTYVYLASTWATPELDIGDEVIDCYKMQSKTDGWDSDTYWPESSRKILKGK